MGDGGTEPTVDGLTKGRNQSKEAEKGNPGRWHSTDGGRGDRWWGPLPHTSTCRVSWVSKRNWCGQIQRDRVPSSREHGLDFTEKLLCTGEWRSCAMELCGRKHLPVGVLGWI